MQCKKCSNCNICGCCCIFCLRSSQIIGLLLRCFWRICICRTRTMDLYEKLLIRNDTICAKNWSKYVFQCLFLDKSVWFHHIAKHFINCFESFADSWNSKSAKTEGTFAKVRNLNNVVIVGLIFHMCSSFFLLALLTAFVTIIYLFSFARSNYFRQCRVLSWPVFGQRQLL